ncbi:MAG: hypothetical protein NTY47_00025, partial [Candidatus Omnitrophica bacterium]|nr:hypothetical protein [Candidatus Omnitrophota bacterium]
MVPVALFTYNRPIHLSKVLDALKANNIALLYVFSDAARDCGDIDKVREVRKIIDAIDWVEKKVIKEDINKGVARSIVDGVSRVLKEHESIIVLEDDCVPAQDFYDYMLQCLEHYKNEEKIFCVSAYLLPVKSRIFAHYPYDVFFWGRFWSWGWGTWRRSWEKFNCDFVSLIKEAEKQNIDTSLFGQDVSMARLRKMICRNDTWAGPFFLTMALNKTLSVYPKKSYIKNIG